MQQPLPTGNLIPLDVGIRLAGAAVSSADVVSVSIDREIPDPLSGSGHTAATGTITMTTSETVAAHPPTPWDPGTQRMPLPESPVTVSMDAGQGPVTILDGRVAAVGGGTSAREMDVGVTDLYQTLERSISWGTLSDHVPSPTEGVTTRYVGLHSMAVTDRILRHCGWYATPPQLAGCVLSVPAVGTMIPEKGELLTSATYGREPGDDGLYPLFSKTGWGMGATNVSSTYAPTATYTLAAHQCMELTAMTGTITDRNTMAMTVSSASAAIRLTWSATTVNVWITGSGGTDVLGATVARVDGFVYATIEYLSATSLRVTLRNAAGAQNQRTVTVASAATSEPYTGVRIQGDQVGSGFQVSYPGTAGTLAAWKPTAVLHRFAASSHMLKAVPPVQSEKCADLLTAQCEAEAATYWIDELGVLQWWHIQQLEAGSSVATLTSDHIAEGGFTWDYDYSSVKSRVVMKWKDWAYSGSTRSRIDLWQGGGTTLEPGQVVDEFVSVPTDEVWLQPDLTFDRIGDTGVSYDAFNNGTGSWWGGVLQDKDTWAQEQSSLAFTIARVSGGTFKYTLKWTGTDGAEMKTVSSDNKTTAVGKNKRSMNLPILRGKGKYTFTDMAYTAQQTGPATAIEYEIDAGWWVQEVEQAKRVTDYAASRLTVAQPVISSIDLIVAPGIQLGDIVTIVEDEVSRLTIRGLVTGDQREIGEESASHRITVRPLSVTRNGVTWEEWGEAMKSPAWQAWGASMAGKTWASWGANPLQN